MLKMTLWNSPRFSFDMLDPLIKSRLGSSGADSLLKNRYALREGLISIAVIAEFSEVPITVEFDRYGFEPVDETKWDRIVEVPISLQGKFLVFDDMEEFGRLELWPGNFRVRIYYGGQNTRQLDGSSNDFYLIQIWPSDDKSEKVIKS